MTLSSTDVAILCGGRGSRLGHLTAYTPKCLLPIEGRPFLDWLLAWLAPHHPRKIVLCTGYLHDAVAQWAKHKPVTLSRDATDLPGDAAPLLAAPLSSDPVLVLNGDTYADIDLADLLRRYAAPATLAYVRKFGDEHPHDCGVRLLSQACLSDLRAAVDLARSRGEAPPQLGFFLRSVSTRASMKGLFYDYGTPQTYKGAHRFFRPRA